VVATAWHKTVIANSPLAYKSFYDNYGNTPYGKSALNLQVQPKAVPLMQFTHLVKVQPSFKPNNGGISPVLGISKDNLGAQAHMPLPSKIVTLPAKGTTINPINGGNNNVNPGKVTTLPGKINPIPVNAGNANGGTVTPLPGKIGNPANAGNNGSTPGKVTTLPGKINSNPVRVIDKPVVTTRPVITTKPVVTTKPVITTAPRNFSGGTGGNNSNQRFATQSRNTFAGSASFKR
jgi:hypothetical protein